MLLFIAAIEETVYQNPETHNDGPRWKQQMISSYNGYYHEKLNIPRWSDIQNRYVF